MKACKGFGRAWKLHDLTRLVGNALASSTKNILHQRVHTFAEKDYEQDGLPAAHTPIIGV